MAHSKSKVQGQRSKVAVVGGVAVCLTLLLGSMSLAQGPQPRSLPTFEADAAWPQVPAKWKLGDPSSFAIDAQDNVWYSDYARGYLGMLNPTTSEVKEWASPGGPGSQPYGIAVINGKIWYSEAGVQPNTVVVFDPATEKFQTWPIPSGGGVVRNVSVTKDGNLAMALSGVNKIALVEIRR